MYKKNKILITVCARGGSKGVKNKNIELLNNKPIISYSLDIINTLDFIDDYVISTDSEEIINVVKKYGFKINFKRPKKLAQGKVSRIDVIKHAVEWMEKNNKIKYDIVIDLGVATPLKNSTDVKNAIDLFFKKKASNVISVTPSSRNPYYNMLEVINDKIKKVKTHKQKITDRRDAPKVYSMNDGIYIWKKEVLFSKSPLVNNNTSLYVMPAERSVDIDEEIDLLLAKALIEKSSEK